MINFLLLAGSLALPFDAFAAEHHTPAVPVEGLMLSCQNPNEALRSCRPFVWVLHECDDKVLGAFGNRWQRIPSAATQLEVNSMLAACLAANANLAGKRLDKEKAASWALYRSAKAIDPSFAEPDFKNTYGIK